MPEIPIGRETFIRIKGWLSADYGIASVGTVAGVAGGEFLGSYVVGVTGLTGGKATFISVLTKMMLAGIAYSLSTGAIGKARLFLVGAALGSGASAILEILRVALRKSEAQLGYELGLATRGKVAPQPAPVLSPAAEVSTPAEAVAAPAAPATSW